ncbi:hypothetical protein L249_4272 [Ophiocordyceps polyrhachis-furcata BCC 54312]|uniref:Uncharacterized protein n=1 Tax=Ophiocordyceps polyrhachis-furcata BCC 54312 TaxID=1330021 RepID=A0A367L884_9HYPO|nr:hypothetical protein L249_4272 [Ophiocordyceps polyrhachis-furcata BCC 54312]
MWGKSGEEEDESRDSGFIRIEEELKAGEYSASIAYSAPIDVTAALYSAPIAVTIAVTSRSGAITAIALL